MPLDYVTVKEVEIERLKKSNDPYETSPAHGGECGCEHCRKHWSQYPNHPMAYAHLRADTDED